MSRIPIVNIVNIRYTGRKRSRNLTLKECFRMASCCVAAVPGCSAWMQCLDAISAWPHSSLLSIFMLHKSHEEEEEEF